MTAPLVECVPNFSEGRDAAIIDALRSAITGVAGVQLLDVQSDAAHNRSVFTLVGTPDAMVEAAFAAMRALG
jgi:glutamate formiminotransferase